MNLVESDEEQVFQDAVPRLPPLTNGHQTTLAQIHRIPSSTLSPHPCCLGFVPFFKKFIVGFVKATRRTRTVLTPALSSRRTRWRQKSQPVLLHFRFGVFLYLN